MFAVELQRSAPSVLRSLFLEQLSSSSVKAHRAGDVFAVGFIGFECHASSCAFHDDTSFGIEVYDGRCLLHLSAEVAHVWAFRHVVAVDSGGTGFVVEWKDALIELFIIAIKLFGHFLVEEPLFGGPGMGMLIFSPVKLPSRVSPQLIEATVERIAQNERACSLSVLQLHMMSLEHIAFLVPEFGVKELA